MSIKIEETRVELVPGHTNQPVQQIQQLWRPVQVLLHDQAAVGIVTRSVPGYQAGLVLPFTSNFNLIIMINKKEGICNSFKTLLT